MEPDGSVHAQPSQTRRDASRHAELKRAGYTVTRFPNGIVLEAPELFLEKVLDVLRGHCRMLSPASCELQRDGRRLVTPSPGPPRLKKTPAAVHPLPQGGEGGKPRKAEKSQHKCRNSRAGLKPRPSGSPLRASRRAEKSGLAY